MSLLFVRLLFLSRSLDRSLLPDFLTVECLSLAAGDSKLCFEVSSSVGDRDGHRGFCAAVTGLNR